MRGRGGVTATLTGKMEGETVLRKCTGRKHLPEPFAWNIRKLEEELRRANSAR